MHETGVMAATPRLSFLTAISRNVVFGPTTCPSHSSTHCIAEPYSVQLKSHLQRNCSSWRANRLVKQNLPGRETLRGQRTLAGAICRTDSRAHLDTAPDCKRDGARHLCRFTFG